MSDEIEYSYVKGRGWVAKYVSDTLDKELEWAKAVSEYLRVGVLHPEEVFTPIEEPVVIRVGNNIVYFPRAVMYMDDI